MYGNGRLVFDHGREVLQVEPDHYSCHLEVDEICGEEGGGAWAPIDKRGDESPRFVSYVAFRFGKANKMQ